MDERHVFISHSADDREIAQRVCSGLEDEGLRCWIAPRDIETGRDWPEAIVEAISRSRAFVLIFSSRADASSQVKREVERAAARKVPILPFRIE